MNNYFLIARNRINNNYTVLKLNDAWYLDDGKSTGKLSRANSLEAIDLVTSQFDSREHMAQRLYSREWIDNPDVDIFIASKRKKEGRTYIKFDEVIYGGKASRCGEAIRLIAKNSMNGEMTADKDAMSVVYDAIISRVFVCNDFYSMICSGDTNISVRFSNLLRKVPQFDEIPYDLKYDRYFRFSNYLEVRNVVEALNRFDGFSYSSRNDRIQKNYDFIDENYSDRMALTPMLALELDRDYCEGQLSMFDFFDSSDSKRIRDASKLVAEDERRPIKQVEAPKEKLSVSEMQKEVFRILDTLPTNIFRTSGNVYSFNSLVFTHPLLEEEENKLNSLLTGNMPKFFMSYALHKQKMHEAQMLGEYSEAGELQELCDTDIASINKRFRSSKCVANTYRWCMLFEGCRKRDEVYAASGIKAGNGDVDAKVFEKKQ